MKPIKFEEMNATAAEDQPEYMPLPMYRDTDSVVSCWSMSWKERLVVLFIGKVWLCLLMRDAPITPSLLQVDSPFEKERSTYWFMGLKKLAQFRPWKRCT